MKTVLTTLVCISGLLATANAQISERAARNVLIGSVAGAIIGENNDHRALEGALIGAAAGAVWTAATDSYSEPTRVEYRDAPRREYRRGGDVVVVNPDCGPRVIVQERRHRPDRVIIRDRDCDDTRVIIRDRDYDNRRVIIRDNDCDNRRVIIRGNDCDSRVIVVKPAPRVIIRDNDCDSRRVDYYSERRSHRTNRSVIYSGSSATYVQVD